MEILIMDEKEKETINSEVCAGSCLCGEVSYQYSGSLRQFIMCHCNQCKRASGTAFTSNVIANSEGIKWEGKDLIREFESSPGKFRGFCQLCGSSMYSRRTNLPTQVRLRVGTMSSFPYNLKPIAHIFCSDIASWETIPDAGLLHYLGIEDGR